MTEHGAHNSVLLYYYHYYYYCFLACSVCFWQINVFITYLFAHLLFKIYRYDVTSFNGILPADFSQTKVVEWCSC